MRRDTLLDFFDDLSALRGDVPRLRQRVPPLVVLLCGGRPAPPRAFGARLARRRARQGRRGHLLVREPARMDRRALGLLAAGRRRRADRLSRLAGPARARRRDRQRARRPGRRRGGPAGACRDRRRRCGRSRALDWRSTARRPARDDRARRHRRRSSSRRAPPPSPRASIITHRQHPRQHRAGRARDREVPQVRAALLAHPLPQPAAAQPHVRAVDGDLHPADAAAARSSSCGATTRTTSSRQIKSRRVSVLVSVPKILDVLREHVLRVAPESADAAARRRSTSRGAGGATAARTARSA